MVSIGGTRRYRIQDAAIFSQDMPGQRTCAPPVIVTLPAQLEAAAAEQAADQIAAAFTPGVSVVIADLTAAAQHVTGVPGEQVHILRSAAGSLS